MDLSYQISKGGMTSIIALIATYPIDIWKINNQTRIKNKINLSNVYRGFGKTALLTFPEKGVKLGVYQYFKNKEKNNGFSLNGAILTSFFQSKFATPIDNIKISNLKNIRIKSLKGYYSGLSYIYGRDLLFNLFFFYNADENTFSNNKPLNNLLSGMVATSIATPFDVIKTRCQEYSLERKKFDFFEFTKKTPYNDYLKGIIGRNLSVGIFYSISYSLFSLF